MSINVSQYLSKKTVKLSDAFVVHIKNEVDGRFDKFKDIFGAEYTSNDKTEYEAIGKMTHPAVVENENNEVNCVIPNCVSVKIPSLKMSSGDTLRYNNFERNFIHLDFDSRPENLDLVFYETSDEKIKAWINYLMQVNGGNEINHGTYNPFNAITELKVYILNNDLSKSVYAYTFNKCRLVGYDYNYAYDYRANDLPQVLMQFSFEEMKMGVDNTVCFDDKTLKPANIVGKRIKNTSMGGKL